MITVSVLIVSGINIEIWKFRFPGYQIVTLTVSVFGPESVSYERSRRENRATFHEILARVFFETYQKVYARPLRRVYDAICVFTVE